MNEPSSLSSIAFNTGVIAERSRIIKLLETEHWFYRELEEKIHDPDCPTCQHIALIKGENTDKSTVHTSADNAITNTQGENK